MDGTITWLRAEPGQFIAFVIGERLVALEFDDRPRTRARLAKRFGPIEWREGSSRVAERVRAYLDGELDALSAIEVDPGGTPFQQTVWTALRKIPVGTTVSYGELARAIGQPTAVRAVARANALNPIALVIPCHRVIGSDGTLTGYAGGLPRKQWLIDHESRQGTLFEGHSPSSKSAE